jgi:hypothetical protein
LGHIHGFPHPGKGSAIKIRELATASFFLFPSTTNQRQTTITTTAHSQEKPRGKQVVKPSLLHLSLLPDDNNQTANKLESLTIYGMKPNLSRQSEIQLDFRFDNTLPRVCDLKLTAPKPIVVLELSCFIHHAMMDLTLP